jgi:hypothetical protein
MQSIFSTPIFLISILIFLHLCPNLIYSLSFRLFLCWAGMLLILNRCDPQKWENCCRFSWGWGCENIHL